MSSNTARASTGALRRQLFIQTWPMAIGVLSMLGFQLVDSAFVARLGTQPLAAQSFTFPLTFLMIGIQVGLGIAIAALISRAIGAGERQRARRLASLVAIGGSAVMALIALGLWRVPRPLFHLLGADADLIGLIAGYWAVQLVADWLKAVYRARRLGRVHGVGGTRRGRWQSVGRRHVLDRVSCQP